MSTAVHRLVPGAPPPIELSKSQRKKRKPAKADDLHSPVLGGTSGAGDDEDVPKVQLELDIVADAGAAEHPPHPESLDSHGPQPLSAEEKSSPIVDLVNRRLKAISKKIGRISTYAATDISKLNDDQIRSLKNLPTLEAAQKELVEVKKSIEVHEHELVQELATKRLEAEKAEKARISNAISDAEASLLTQFGDIFNVLRLHSLVTSGALDISPLTVSSELSALYSFSNILLGEPDQRQPILEQLVRGVGEFEGIPYTRLLAITHQAFNAPPPPSPEPVESEDEEQVTAAPSTSGAEEEAVAGIPGSNSMSGSFQFIQQSELEQPYAPTEWIKENDTSDDAEEPLSTVSEHRNEGLDWADEEEGGLPPIAGLQAEFGNSGSVTPAEVDKTSVPEASWHGETTNGDVHNAPAETPDDGFTQARGRGRGRGGRGERGAFRSGGRGERGGYRGNERGGGRGGRGERPYRGRHERHEEGERVRDGDGGDGERGGRGRGRGRGGRGGEHRGRGGFRGDRGDRGDRG